MKTIKIKGRTIGDGEPAYIIAEMSANHSGSIERAKEIIRAAKESGADCVKIQTYTPDTLTIDCDNEYFRLEKGAWKGENLYSLYGKAHTPWEWQKILKEEADRIGIDFFSTPFDKTSVDFLENIGVEFYKIASFEMIDIPLLKYVASKGKPMIISTGMGTMEEMEEAVEAIYGSGNNQLALLKCSSAYPAISDDMNLKTIVDMKQKLQVPIGLSDHSMGYIGAVTGVALGANIIEKHFCISREIKNPDASFSMNPTEFKEMVGAIRQAERAMGKIFYGVSRQEENSLVFRRSIFVVEEIKKGECFTEKNVRIIRPGYGIAPKYMTDVLGMKAGGDISKGMPFSFEQIEKNSILFLSNNEESVSLYRWLKEQENEREVYHLQNKVTLEMVQKIQPYFIVSYNYKHILPGDLLDFMEGRAVNLHVSFLPYNRGSSPNFFSFLENTPKGVTIHEMDRKLDKGRMLCRKSIEFDEEKESFVSSYQKLQEEIKKLFQENWHRIKAGNCGHISTVDKGTYHTMEQLNDFRKEHPFEWEDNIAEKKRQWGISQQSRKENGADKR